MKPLLTKTALAQLRLHVSEPCLWVFDFDGVLAPIIADREHAAVSEQTARLMAQLAAKVPVAVLSGRGRADVKKRLSFKTRFLLGNHGLEGPPEFAHRRELAARATSKWASALRRLNRQSPVPGFDLEAKKYSLSIHFHKARAREASLQTILDWSASLRPRARIVLGKGVVNLVHPRAATKGDGLLWLLKRTKLKRAVYIGDDVTDEDVFRLKDPRVFSIHVGRNLRSAAKYRLADRILVDRFLQACLAMA